MSILRAAVRIRDEPARAHSTAAPGHPRAVPALLAHVYTQQHRAPAHRSRAPQPEPDSSASSATDSPQPHTVTLLVLFSTELPLLWLGPSFSCSYLLPYLPVIASFEFIQCPNTGRFVRSESQGPSPLRLTCEQ